MICDFAEYYHIIDLKALPVRLLAVLSCGLPPQSRTMRRESGQKLMLEETLLAGVFDRLSVLCWLNSSDGQHGRNRPKPVLPELLKDDEEKYETYADGAAFMAARDAILGGETL